MEQSGEGSDCIYTVDLVIRHGKKSDLSERDLNAPRVIYLDDTKEFIVSRGDGTYENITSEILALQGNSGESRMSFDGIEAVVVGAVTATDEDKQLTEEQKTKAHDWLGIYPMREEGY